MDVMRMCVEEMRIRENEKCWVKNNEKMGNEKRGKENCVDIWRRKCVNVVKWENEYIDVFRRKKWNEMCVVSEYNWI